MAASSLLASGVALTCSRQCRRDDTIDVQDGVAGGTGDAVDCGEGIDTVTADPDDEINANCEN